MCGTPCRLASFTADFELSNRMAEKSSEIIKYLMNMKVMATINHSIDKDIDNTMKRTSKRPVAGERILLLASINILASVCASIARGT